MTESSTPIADLVAKMLSAGLSADIIVQTVRTIEAAAGKASRASAAAAETLNRKRESDRQRKKVARASVRGLSADVSTDTNGHPSPLLSSSKISVVKKESKGESARVSADSPRTKRGTSLPEDWQLSDADLQCGIDLGLTEVEVRNFVEDMRLWAKANANRAIGRKADWSSTLRGWLRREAAKVDRSKRGRDRGPSFLDIAMGRQHGQ